MHVSSREKERIESALREIDACGSEGDRTEVVLIRQQRALHTSYVEACAKIERFGDTMRASDEDLVALSFPMRLTQRTRASVEDGLYRSFLHFLQDLHGSVCNHHGGALADSVTNVHTFLAKLTNVLTLESCRILDGVVSHAEARSVCVSYIEKCRAVAVREESAYMLTLDQSCAVVLEALSRFSTRAADMRKAVTTRMRAFLKTCERKGLSTAAARLLREPHLQTAMSKHGWLLGGVFEDAKIVRIYELLLLTHIELAQTLSWQRRRVSWLASANSANRCWCGVSTGTGVEGILVHAPAHMRRFSGEERVRLLLETQEVPFSCYLSSSGVANVILELLHGRRLPLNRIAATYANRILTFEFCKYENAARTILEDTIRPWLKRVQSDLVY